ncbi:hypothetical protein CPB83DRAFT_838757 [Crepidotus variabilis]|uniref:BZIP domain-containing protein n=1 Tax=Crepidotus variabilis TaxID=179855 RepID=A0A9P6E8I4_9AGAR|nr:hypothetical protein CPB83DRAFT_838757 [Crepidotus variabilis]
MDSFPEIVAPMWDISNPDQQQQYNQFQDQDFFALFQKPYGAIPGNGVATNGYPTYPAGGINPQNVSSFSLPVLTPPSASEDSSPSPPNHNRQDSPDQESQDPALKRKASSEELDDEPNHKSQHTDSSADKRNGVRRKSSGKDETRLMKRKEQNRAAQRAFRERKEKHVKDLEDKVAELEAKNERAQHENENLRDLLTRLQSENMTLKQTSFTFSVPKDGSTPSSQFSAAPTPSSSSSDPTSPKLTNPLDWSSLTTFDPNMLNLLDDNLSQPTATEGAMQMNFGFGNTGSLNAPFTTIASNPMFMSFPSTFDSPGDNSSPGSNGNINEGNTGFGYDLNALVPWNGSSTGASTSTNSDHVFDDLFSGYLTAIGNNGSGGSSASVSPVTHHTSPSALANRAASGSSNSPSVLGTESLFSMTSTPSSVESPPSLGCDGTNKGCPKTREEVAERIEAEGDSVFAPPIHKSNDNVLGTMIKCTGSKFPKTVKSDQNIEVLAAWRSIRADPKYKDVDINDLCHQFTNKARCDGTKVVLEPVGVSQILDSIAKPKSSQL